MLCTFKEISTSEMQGKHVGDKRFTLSWIAQGKYRDEFQGISTLDWKICHIRLKLKDKWIFWGYLSSWNYFHYDDLQKGELSPGNVVHIIFVI